MKTEDVVNQENTVYVVDVDHTLLNLIPLFSLKTGISPDKFTSPTMQVDGIDRQKIFNAWVGEDAVYHDIIKVMQSSTFYEFRNHRMPQVFNENVYNVLENKLVVFVSSSFSQQGTQLKSKIVNLYRRRLNPYTEEGVPTDLISFADKSYEEHSYKNTIAYLQLLDYHVVCVDDNLVRLEWADELGCDALLVPQVWNEVGTKFRKV